MATTVGIRELKNRLSEYVERVEAGEVVTITKRGRPVARVMPADVPPALARLVAEGKLEWSGGKPELPEPTPLRGEGPTMAEYVVEGRR